MLLNKYTLFFQSVYLSSFFWCGLFLKSLFNLLQYCFRFMFWPRGSGILALWPRIKLTLLHGKAKLNSHSCMERRSLKHLITREVVTICQICCKFSINYPKASKTPAYLDSFLNSSWIDKYFSLLKYTNSDNKMKTKFHLLRIWKSDHLQEVPVIWQYIKKKKKKKKAFWSEPV